MELQRPVNDVRESTIDDLLLIEQSTLTQLDVEMNSLSEAERKKYKGLVEDVVAVEEGIRQLPTDDYKRRGELEAVRRARTRFVDRFWHETDKRKAVLAARAPLLDLLIDARTQLQEKGYYLPEQE